MKKILIVEDEVIVALELKHRLTKLGYDVIGVASNAEKAIEIICSNKPDLILMDLKLRGKMNGLELAEKVYNDHTIPSLFITAFFDEETLNKVKQKLSFEILQKPFSPEELIKAIKRSVNNKNID
ncbi:MAG: response regulator [Melioribacter sp.]|nr:response regulator [Melioribacter sp.]